MKRTFKYVQAAWAIKAYTKTAVLLICRMVQTVLILWGNTININVYEKQQHEIQRRQDKKNTRNMITI